MLCLSRRINFVQCGNGGCNNAIGEANAMVPVNSTMPGGKIAENLRTLIDEKARVLAWKQRIAQGRLTADGISLLTDSPSEWFATSNDLLAVKTPQERLLRYPANVIQAAEAEAGRIRDGAE